MLSGFMSRSGPNGWEAVLYDTERRLGSLPENSELFEVLRQGADLLMSGKSSGTICGSTKEFNVLPNQMGARYISIPIVGTTWVLTENHTPGHRSPIRLTMYVDFKFPEVAAEPQNEDAYEGD
jgi:hypothetical protein